LLGTYQMNTQEIISIKAKYENEIRRFALPVKSTFATLETSLNSLFSLSSPVIKYTDDEGDLCTISTQQELDFALALNQGLLRLHLFSSGDVPQIPPSVLPTPTCSANPHQDRKQFWLEKLENKHARLVAKRTELDTKLAEKELTKNEDRVRVLTWKREKVQEKIAMVEARKQQITQNTQNPQEKPWKGGKGRGGCGGRRGREHAQDQQEDCKQDPQQKQQRWIEWMDKRQSNLISKRDSINAKLAEGELSPERRTALGNKLEKVQEKLSALEMRKQQLAQGGGCRGGRGGRGCGRGARFDADSTPK